MSQTLQGLNCPPGANIASLQKMWLVRAEHVASIQEACGGSYIAPDPVMLIPGAVWVEYEFDFDVAQYAFSPRSTGHGTYYELEIASNFRLLRPELESEMNRLQDGYYLVKILDENGYYRLLGSLESPMRYIGNGVIPSVRSAFNEAVWRFYGVSTHPGFFLPPPGTCAMMQALGMANFIVEPWQIDYQNNSELIGIPISLAPSGGMVIQVLSGSGTVTQGANVVDLVEYNQSSGMLAPVNGPNYLANASYSVTAELTVITSSGNQCTVTFTQTFAYLSGSLPTLVTLSPPNLSSGMPLPAGGNNLVITLSEAVAPGQGSIIIADLTANTTLESLDVNSTRIQFSGSQVFITDVLFQFGRQYQVIIPPGAIRDLSGNSFAGIPSGAWTFTTQPAVQMYLPNTGSQLAVLADYATPWDIIFNQPITRGSGLITLREFNGGTIIRQFDAADSADVELLPDGYTARLLGAAIDLQPFGTVGYHVFAAPGTFIVAGRTWGGISNALEWQVRLETPSFFLLLDYSIPVQGATGIPAAAPIYVIWNQPVQKNTGVVALYEQGSGTALWTGSISADTITPISGNYAAVQIMVPESAIYSGKNLRLEIGFNGFVNFPQTQQSPFIAIEWQRALLAPTAVLLPSGMSAVSNDPACNGNFTAFVNITDSPGGATIAQFSFDQSDFPQGGWGSIWSGLPSGTYYIELFVEDCQSDAQASLSYTLIAADFNAADFNSTDFSV